MRIFVLLIFFVLEGHSQSFGITEMAFKSAVKIENQKGDSRGSGVFYKDSTYVYLISARHIFFDQKGRELNKDDKGNPKIKNKVFHFRYYDRDNLSRFNNFLEVDFEKVFANGQLVKYNEKDDLIVIKIAEILQEKNIIQFSPNILNHTEKRFSPAMYDDTWIVNYDDIEYGKDIWILGYPTSLALANTDQYDFDMPLLQKGILSGKYHKNRTIIANAPVFPGNSGGPVFGLKGRNSVKLLGIAVQFIPLVEEIRQRITGGVSQEWTNSDYSVIEPIEKIYALIEN